MKRRPRLGILMLLLALCSLAGKVAYGQNITWEATASPAEPSIALAFDETTGTLYYASNDYEGDRNVVFGSRDGGNSWDEMTSNLAASQFESLAFSPNGDLFAGTGDGVYRYDSDSSQWEETDLSGSSLVIWSIISDSEGRLFAGAHGPVWLGDAGIFRSVDGGAIWTREVNGLSTVEDGITDVYAFAVEEDDTIYAGTSDGLYRSTDHGDTWNLVGLEEERVTAIVLPPMARSGWARITTVFFDPQMMASPGHPHSVILMCQPWCSMPMATSSLHPTEVVVGGGMYRLLHGATMWDDISLGLPTRIVHALVLDADGRLFAGTESGVYRSMDPTVTNIARDRDKLPQTTTLGANYPNPFRGTTILAFSLQKPGTTTLAIYDVWGRTVATLVDETLLAGQYTVTWEAGDQASGIYVARLRVEDVVQSRQIVLFR